MEITPQLANTMIEARLHEYPQMKAVVDGDNFRNLLIQILDFEKIDQVLLPQIENEVIVVLTLYAQLHELAENISETTGIPITTSKNITALIETLILQPVLDDLTTYDLLWQSELEKNQNLPPAPKDIKDRLELRPEGVPVGGTSQETETSARPITREQLLTALTAKRTMAGDIASIKQSRSEEIPGYEAYRNVQKSE